MTKYYGISGLFLADLLWAIGRLTYLLRRRLGLGAQGKESDPKCFMLDILWGDLRAVLNGQAWRIARKRT